MTTDIWDGIPEAEAFCNNVVNNIDQYKLFPGETFVAFSVGILATTGIDGHGESFDLQGLKSAADHINNRRLWAAVMHDPTIQPAGRAISAKIFRSPRTGHYVLAGVMGQYATERLPTFTDVGITETVLSAASEVSAQPTASLTPAILGYDTNDFDEAIIVAALSEAPAELNIRTQRHFRKALDPITIISVSVSIAALSKVAFLDELQKEAAKALFAWLKASLFPRICQPRRTLFEFTSEFNGCRVQFVSRATDVAVLSEATDHFEEASQSARLLLETFDQLGFDKLVYEYDEKAKKWLPLHAATTKFGVISNRPQLIAMDQLKGFSLSGVAGKVTIAKALPQAQPAMPALPEKVPPSSEHLSKKPEKNQKEARRTKKNARNKAHKAKKGKR
jgi:hypothetical protein